MNETQVPAPTTTPSRACLAIGCNCRDMRIVSARRVAFFADLARTRGETADRVIRAEAAWAIPRTVDLHQIEGAV